MSKSYGVVHDGTGYLMAEVEYERRGACRVRSCRHLPYLARVRDFLLAGKPVRLAVASYWLREQSASGRKDICFLPGAVPSFSRAYRQSELSFHAVAVAASVAGAAGDDVYLAVLPMACIAGAPASFISVFSAGEYFRIGIVIDGKLCFSLRMAPGGADMLASHLERVRIFWTRERPGIPFPVTTYIMGNCSNGVAMTPLKPVGLDNAQEAAYEAAGAALSACFRNTAPSPAVPAVSQSTLKIRAAVRACSFALVILSIAAYAFSWGSEALASRRNAQAAARYRSIVENNADIRQLLNETDALAESVSDLYAKLSARTSWGQLLDALAMQRPDGIVLERMGSQPDEKDGACVRIALSGSAGDEKQVTEYIARLGSISFLSDIRLLSIERSKKQDNRTLFRISGRMQMEGRIVK